MKKIIFTGLLFTVLSTASSYALSDMLGRIKIREKSFIDLSTVRILGASPKDDGTLSVCTATVLTKRHLLTAAHCIEDLNIETDSIVLQTFSGNTPLDESSTYQPGSLEVFIHPNYVSHTAYDDIAIMKFKDSSALNNLTPVVLPRTNLLGKKGTYYIAGAGSYKSNQELLESVPGQSKKALKSLKRNEKAAFYKLIAPLVRELRFTYGTYTNEQNVRNQTAYNFKVSGDALVCKGDSGGPTFFFNGKSVYQVGVHSYVKRKNFVERKLRSINNICGSEFYSEPVFKHIDWIKDTLKR